MILGPIYNVIENDLKNLSLQTALLESCDWDEALLEEFTSQLSMVLQHVTTECTTIEKAKSLLKEILEINGWINGQYDIVIQIMDMHTEEIKSYMMLEEQ
jgi:enamine deaminase RidA (YjgF/YER057c/UK114 family)